MTGALPPHPSPHSHRPWPRWAVVVCLAAALLFSVLAWGLFRHHITPFQATVDATTLEFTLANGADILDANSLLASPASLDLGLTCDSLRYLNAPRSQDIRCPPGGAVFHNVRLRSLAYGPNTTARLSVADHGVVLHLTRAANGPAFRMSLMADRDSTLQIGENAPTAIGPGEWLATDASPACTLNLQELTPGSLSYPETGIRLAGSGGLFFDTADAHVSSLVGHSSSLLFSELPSPNDLLPLGDGGLLIYEPTNGILREIAITRSAHNHPQALHVVFTGSSRRIMCVDLYSDQPENQALRYFDIILRIRHQPALLGVLAIVALLLKLVSHVLSNLPQYKELVKSLVQRSNGRRDPPQPEIG